MTIGERIKELRTDKLHMNQTDFGSKIGLKYAAIGLYEKNQRSVSDRSISDICREFSVSEEWLRYGTGDPFIEPTTFSLDEYAKSKSLSEREIVLVQEFMNLDSTVRNALFGMFEKAFSSDVWNGSPYEDCPKTPEELEKQFPPIEDRKNSDVS